MNIAPKALLWAFLDIVLALLNLAAAGAAAAFARALVQEGRPGLLRSLLALAFSALAVALLILAVILAVLGLGTAWRGGWIW